MLSSLGGEQADIQQQVPDWTRRHRAATVDRGHRGNRWRHAPQACAGEGRGTELTRSAVDRFRDRLVVELLPTLEARLDCGSVLYLEATGRRGIH